MTTTLALVLWAVALVVFVCRAWFGKAPVAGLTLCYWLNLASVHVPTEVLYLIHRNASRYRTASIEGFPLTGWAVLGLLAGNLFLAQPLHVLLRARRPDSSTPPGPAAGVRLAKTAIFVGLLLFLVGNILEIPSLSSVMGGGNMLAAGGFAWWWWVAYRSGRRLEASAVLVGALIPPFLILVFHGFLSFGIFALFTVAAFVMVRFRPRAVVLIASPVFLYLGLSACVTWLNGRDDIRHSIWHEQAATSDRAKVIETVFSDSWLWFSPTDEAQREYLDARFDQNYFLGLTAMRIQSGQQDFAHGETVANAAFALIPRIIWLDKPAYVGGNEKMARFTGLTFASGSTFGLGHALEAYINFGVPGLVVCFLILGGLIGLFDLRAGLHLTAGRAEAFLLWFVPGQAFLKGGEGSFAEVTGGVAGCLVLTWGLLKLLHVLRGAGQIETRHVRDGSRDRRPEEPGN